MRLIDNKERNVDNEIDDKAFDNHGFWVTNIDVYLNQKILLSTLVTSDYLIRDIYDEINRE